MSDCEQRTADRSAVLGDRNSETRALAIRVRSSVSGLTTKCDVCGGAPGECDACKSTGRITLPWLGSAGRLALLAYCGHRTARELVCKDGFLPGGALANTPLPLGALVKALDRWPSEVLVRATVLAVDHALDSRALTCEDCTYDCGCPEARICASAHPYPVGTLCPSCAETTDCLNIAQAWLDCPSGRPGGTEFDAASLARNIHAAAYETSKEATRAVIWAGLIAWCGENAKG
jgi:hypothetical protein